MSFLYVSIELMHSLLIYFEKVQEKNNISSVMSDLGEYCSAD